MASWIRYRGRWPGPGKYSHWHGGKHLQVQPEENRDNEVRRRAVYVQGHQRFRHFWNSLVPFVFWARYVVLFLRQGKPQDLLTIICYFDFISRAYAVPRPRKPYWRRRWLFPGPFGLHITRYLWRMFPKRFSRTQIGTIPHHASSKSPMATLVYVVKKCKRLLTNGSSSTSHAKPSYQWMLTLCWRIPLTWVFFLLCNIHVLSPR